MIEYSALFAVFISIGLVFSYYIQSFELAMVLLFLLAGQSAIYSPAKLSYIKELYGKNKISLGNSNVQTTAIIAILSSMAIFSLSFETYLSFESSQYTKEIIME